MPANSGGAYSTRGALTAGAATVTFATNFRSVAVTNNSVTATEVLFVGMGGVTPVAPFNDCTPVAAGQTVMVANNTGFFYQGYGGADGTKTNPGTTVNIVSSVGGSTAGVEVAGSG